MTIITTVISGCCCSFFYVNLLDYQDHSSYYLGEGPFKGDSTLFGVSKEYPSFGTYPSGAACRGAFARKRRSPTLSVAWILGDKVLPTSITTLGSGFRVQGSGFRVQGLGLWQA